MMLRIKQLVSLASLTALESIRQPLCLLLTTACVILTALVPLTLMHNFGEDGKLVRDSGLACHFLFGLFVAGYAACSSLGREVRSGTASTVLSKPVSRRVFFAAKFAGVALLVLAFSFSATLATLLSERVAEKSCFTETTSGRIADWQTGRMLIAAPFAACLIAALINYFARRPFESVAFMMLPLFLLAVLLISGSFDRAGHRAPIDFQVQWRIVPAGILISMALIVLAAIALTLSVVFNTTTALTLTCVVFILGLASDYLFGRHAPTSTVALVVYRSIPNWQHFWISDALTGQGVIPWNYVLNAGLYALAYSTGILCLGSAAFNRAEIN